MRADIHENISYSYFALSLLDFSGELVFTV